MAKLLIGFMGAGKTTIASLLTPNFVDMDSYITAQIGMPIATFFSQRGETAFRSIETHVLTDLIETNRVVSTGGGVAESEVNRTLLKKNKDNIYLKSDFETLYSRLQEDIQNQRPIFLQNTKDDLQLIFKNREQFYKEVARQVIDVTNKTPNEIIDEIK